MMKLLPLLLTLLESVLLSQAYIFQKCSSQSAVSDSKVVQTLNGAVKGECYNVPVSYSNSSTSNYDVFTWLSIPFAESPTGSNRFMKPKPVKSWNKTLDALSWPKTCVQDGIQINPGYFSEDCLYLNIFVRNDTYFSRNASLAPIMLWIYGGGFTVGSSAQDRIEPSTIVASKNVIIVTINYRVNVFGFLHLADSDATGNVGFLDQTMAMKWVYDNAKSFGGDNSKITIYGESAGSWSVGFHLFFPQSWPYFRNAILESGAPTGSNNFYYLSSSADANKEAETFLNNNGCKNGTKKERLSCAQKIDAAIILNSTALPNKFVRYPFDRLVIDNYVFFKSIDELVNENKFKKCNIITGYNSDEFGYFLPYYFPLDKTPNNLNTFNAMVPLLQLSYNKQANPLLIENIKEKYFGTRNLESLDQNSIDYFRKFIQLQGDVLFVCPALDLAEVFSKSGVKAYAYEYKYRIPSSPFPIQLGNAVHTEEIYMVFGEPLSNKVPPLLGGSDPYSASAFNYSVKEKLFAEKITTYWTDFAKYDDPNYSKKNPLWNPFTDSLSFNFLSAQNKMRLGEYLLFTNDNIAMNYDFSSHKCDFWNYTKNGKFFDMNININSSQSMNSNLKGILFILMMNMLVIFSF